jgi:hypothetical protein
MRASTASGVKAASAADCAINAEDEIRESVRAKRVLVTARKRLDVLIRFTKSVLPGNAKASLRLAYELT